MATALARRCLDSLEQTALENPTTYPTSQPSPSLTGPYLNSDRQRGPDRQRGGRARSSQARQCSRGRGHGRVFADYMRETLDTPPVRDVCHPRAQSSYVDCHGRCRLSDRCSDDRAEGEHQRRRCATRLPWACCCAGMVALALPPWPTPATVHTPGPQCTLPNS
jgi:hypothetical protein